MPPRPPSGTSRIVAELAKLGPMLPGTVTRRYTRCGRAGCRCMADPPRPHGPYWSWTRKVANKTVTRYLSDDQYARYQPWFDNARRARELLGQLESLSLGVVEADPRSHGRGGQTSAGTPESGAKSVDKARSRRR